MGTTKYVHRIYILINGAMPHSKGRCAAVSWNRVECRQYISDILKLHSLNSQCGVQADFMIGCFLAYVAVILSRKISRKEE